jgi:hypothetical protein
MATSATVRVVRIREDQGADFASSFARLAAFVSSFRCGEHGEDAALITAFRSRAGIWGCCQALLDRVEHALQENDDGK